MISWHVWRPSSQKSESRLHQLIVDRKSFLDNDILGAIFITSQQKQQLESLEKEMEKQISSPIMDYDKQIEIFLAARQKWEILDEAYRRSTAKICVQP